MYSEILLREGIRRLYAREGCLPSLDVIILPRKARIDREEPPSWLHLSWLRPRPFRVGGEDSSRSPPAVMVNPGHPS